MAKEVSGSSTTEVILEMPIMLELPALGYKPRKVELRISGLPSVQEFVKRLTMTLESREECLANGKPVRGCAAACVWLLEKHAAEG